MNRINGSGRFISNRQKEAETYTYKLYNERELLRSYVKILVEALEECSRISVETDCEGSGRITEICNSSIKRVTGKGGEHDKAARTF
jgi:hypothetical protein